LYPTQHRVIEPNPTQPNPTHGWIQPCPSLASLPGTELSWISVVRYPSRFQKASKISDRIVSYMQVYISQTRKHWWCTIVPATERSQRCPWDGCLNRLSARHAFSVVIRRLRSWYWSCKMVLHSCVYIAAYMYCCDQCHCVSLSFCLSYGHASVLLQWRCHTSSAGNRTLRTRDSSALGPKCPDIFASVSTLRPKYLESELSWVRCVRKPKCFRVCGWRRVCTLRPRGQREANAISDDSPGAAGGWSLVYYIAQHNVRPIATHVAWPVYLISPCATAWVCLVTAMCPAKTAEPIRCRLGCELVRARGTTCYMGSRIQRLEALLGNNTSACPHLPAVDILKFIRKEQQLWGLWLLVL